MLTIVDYRDSWPNDFRTIARTIRDALGPLALRVDHIGSTAVPGLATKDVIDVQITVAALVPEVIERLTAIGYTHVARIEADHRPPNDRAPYDVSPTDDEWRKWFFRAPAEQRPTNTHVRVAGRANQRYPLLFRDYLRAHPAMTAAYAELKRRLAAELRDPETYPDVKDPAVDLIYLAAEDWAARIGWSVAGESGPASPFGPDREPCRCDQLQSMADEPTSPIEFDARMNEYQLMRRDDAGLERIFFCPFCGGQTPKSRRGDFFQRVSQAEKDRFAALFEKLRTADEVRAEFGRPDHEFELSGSSTTPERDGEPETVRYRAQWTYEHLSTTANVCVFVSRSGQVDFSLSGKQIKS